MHKAQELAERAKRMPLRRTFYCTVCDVAKRGASESTPRQNEMTKKDKCDWLTRLSWRSPPLRPRKRSPDATRLRLIALNFAVDQFSPQKNLEKVMKRNELSRIGNLSPLRAKLPKGLKIQSGDGRQTKKFTATWNSNAPFTCIQIFENRLREEPLAPWDERRIDDFFFNY